MAAADLAADVISAGVAAFLVSPFMVVVDKAVAQNASGEQPLWNSFFRSCRDMTGRPLAFVRQPAFGYLYCTIGGTYLACNLFTTVEERRRVPHPVAKAGTMFVVNTTLSLWKDAAYAQLFGGKKAAPVPYPALAAWWLRDLVGNSVIFVAPSIVSRSLHEEFPSLNLRHTEVQTGPTK